MVRLASGLIPLSIAALALADPIHVPLTRRNTGRRVKDASRYPAAGDFLRSKYGFETVASKLAKRGETVGIELTNQVSLRSSCRVLWRAGIAAGRLLRCAGDACPCIRRCTIPYAGPPSRLPRRAFVPVCAQRVLRSLTALPNWINALRKQRIVSAAQHSCPCVFALFGVPRRLNASGGFGPLQTSLSESSSGAWATALRARARLPGHTWRFPVLLQTLGSMQPPLGLAHVGHNVFPPYLPCLLRHTALFMDTPCPHPASVCPYILPRQIAIRFSRIATAR